MYLSILKREYLLYLCLYVYVEQGVCALISNDWVMAFQKHIWPTALAPSLTPLQLSSSQWSQSSPLGINIQPALALNLQVFSFFLTLKPHSR